MKKNKNVMSLLNREVKKKSMKGMHPNALCKHVANNIDEKTKNLRSNLEGKNLDEFLDINKLAHKQYEVLNEQIVVQSLNTNNVKEINQNQFSGVFIKNALKNSDIKLYETKPLSIPKRPKWIEGISPTEFDRMEREAFLNWRRALAAEEEANMNYSITPFEKNIEVWRQLWLVVEKCHVLIQIVDGRNPLYFHCPDLEKNIGEIDKTKDSILLINKADLMSYEIRKSWADYFKEKGIKFLFFSALEEAKKIEEEEEKKNAEMEEEDDDDYNSDDEEGQENNNIEIRNIIENSNNEKNSNHIENNENNKEKNNNESIPQQEENKEDISTKVFNRDELIQHVKVLTQTKSKNPHNHCYFLGFVGYPNVGKSSVINVLMKKKKVAVACMPGKTKHYQTLFLPEENKEICLMDCPGLVFPSFTSSKADMVVNGIVPIDTIREYHQPIAIIIQAIPRQILENFYKIELPDIYSATQFLQVLAAKRGYISGRALPDEAKTSKMVLKDYVSGKLLYCNLRPDYSVEKHGMIVPYLMDESMKEELNREGELEKRQLIREIPADFDDDFDKINIDVDMTRTLKTNNDNFDKTYFDLINTENENVLTTNEKVMNKEMKRGLKFALKRGQITEEEYEEAFTVGDYKRILTEIQKSTDPNKKNLVGVKIIEIN